MGSCCLLIDVENTERKVFIYGGIVKEEIL